MCTNCGYSDLSNICESALTGYSRYDFASETLESIKEFCDDNCHCTIGQKRAVMNILTSVNSPADDLVEELETIME